MIPIIDLKREYLSIKEELSSVVRDVLESGLFILGEEVAKFEKALSRYAGRSYGIGVNSGTDALFLALKALDIGSGDEVITVSNTTSPTAIAIVNTGAIPVFIDIDPDTFLMNTSQLNKQITKNTKAILPVHLFGNPVDMRYLLEIAVEHGIHVVEDACQAHGAEYMDKKIGSFGVLAAFSFYPTKNLGCYGDGGMLVTDDPELYEKIMQLRQYGWKERYDSEIIGYNSRLDELQAAILKAKLRHLDQWNERRRTIAGIYREYISNPNIILPKEQANSKHVYHQFVVRCKKRDALQKYLSENGIQTQIHYPKPVHKQGAFLKMGIIADLPVTERVSAEILSLPIHPFMRNEEVSAVVKALNSSSIPDNGRPPV
ncbi:DegT/DnrJ/EryC1/StrS family aminotransferase [Omnitrophica bacterium]|nr:DegT/DnrJ/EryC1/StrS family aminotransferase [Candidatus Omnitrophota bacterium]